MALIGTTARRSDPAARRTALLLAILCTMAGLAVYAAPTAAADQVVDDGGFEATDATTRQNDSWETSAENAEMSSDVPRTGQFAALLSNQVAGQPAPSVHQSLVIPRSRLAVLTFWSHVHSGYGSLLELRVTVDGTAVHTSSSVSTTDWTRTSVDATRFADGEPHVLRFEFLYTEDLPAYVAIDDVALFVGEAAEVTLAYKAGRSLFSGTVATDATCRADRTVIIKRAKRGPDPTVDRGATDRTGRFAIRWRAKPGRYYAVVPVSRRADSACLGDRSPRLVVR